MTTWMLHDELEFHLTEIQGHVIMQNSGRAYQGKEFTLVAYWDAQWGSGPQWTWHSRERHAVPLAPALYRVLNGTIQDFPYCNNCVQVKDRSWWLKKLLPLAFDCRTCLETFILDLCPIDSPLKVLGRMAETESYEFLLFSPHLHFFFPLELLPIPTTNNGLWEERSSLLSIPPDQVHKPFP